MHPSESESAAWQSLAALRQTRQIARNSKGGGAFSASASWRALAALSCVKETGRTFCAFFFFCRSFLS